MLRVILLMTAFIILLTGGADVPHDGAGTIDFRSNEHAWMLGLHWAGVCSIHDVACVSAC